jgi:hypothetical protein
MRLDFGAHPSRCGSVEGGVQFVQESTRQGDGIRVKNAAFSPSPLAVSNGTKRSCWQWSAFRPRKSNSGPQFFRKFTVQVLTASTATLLGYLRILRETKQRNALPGRIWSLPEEKRT